MPQSTDQVRNIVGCMTGTSIDGIDAALVRVRGIGLAARCELVRGVSGSLADLIAPLRQLADQVAVTAETFASLARRLAAAHETVIDTSLSGASPDLIAVHGQTVFHRPPDSLQLLAPALLARRFGAPVVFDLRAADLAAGGQGAPITPLADYVLARSRDESRAIVNLGGFCNVTLLPRDSGDPDADIRAIRGGDVCPCNHWLDSVARERLGTPYDDGGREALRGRVDHTLLAQLAAVPIAARSLGTGDEHVILLRSRVDLTPADALATCCAAIATRISLATRGAARLLLAGGGARNSALCQAIEARAGIPVASLATVGIDPAYREAACMAVLGALAMDGVPITLPQITGRGPSVGRAGSWVYP